MREAGADLGGPQPLLQLLPHPNILPLGEGVCESQTHPEALEGCEVWQRVAAGSRPTASSSLTLPVSGRAGSRASPAEGRGGKVADQLGREYNVTNVILNLFQDPLVFAIDAMLSHGSGVQESGAID